MQYKCDVCHDSGSKNQTGDYLDCPACDMPMIRKALNDFVKSLGPTHPEDVALAIHQRALAMAPKQEADHINDVVKMVAPASTNGALTDEEIEIIFMKTGGIPVPEYDYRYAGYAKSNRIKFARKVIAAAGPDAALVALIHKAQSILAHHLPPGGPDAKATISALLGLLDGPESRAALSGAKGN